MTYAIKVTLDTGTAKGSKLAVRNSGKTHTAPTREAAERLLAKCKKYAFQFESFEIVEI